MKPFETYPEDRELLLSLAREIQTPDLDIEKMEKRAIELADLVQAILEDEACVLAS
ncbi:hypothetical protein VQ042_24035 [Aurantimonas sp. A2-1-M11]|uniref:hypothetical protein n=1 Tax=Aurantimonas sp. A2-1-M11 TaxID=3113712 RepID=UPI002F92991E